MRRAVYITPPSVDNNQQASGGIHAEGDDALFSRRVMLQGGKSLLVMEDRGCIGEVNAMLAEVAVCLYPVPFELHEGKCMYNRTSCQG